MSLSRYSRSFVLLALTSLTLSSCGSETAAPPGSVQIQQSLREANVPTIQSVASNDVIVQLFNWPFKTITKEIPSLSDGGYGRIHVSPPNLTIATDQWWGRYQPVDYRLIAGPLGNEAEFRAMIAKAHEYGLQIIVDIVFNHTANPGSPWPKEASQITSSKGALFTSADYHSAGCIYDYNNVDEVRTKRICGGDGDEGLPDLDQNSSRVLSEQRAFLQRLNAMGVDGYRFDAVKHMDPAFFNKLLTPEIADGKFIFGEIIADAGSYDRDLAPYLATNTMGFYDFPLRATIQEAFTEKGSLANLVDGRLSVMKKSLPAGKGVGFVMNHDIPNNEGFRSMILEETDEMLAYAYLMGRDGTTPYVYSDLGAAAGGGLRDERWNRAHRDPKLLSLIKFHNVTREQPMTIVSADTCLIVMKRGVKGIILINKCMDDRSVNLATLFPKSTVMTDALNNAKQSLSEEIEVSGRSSLALIAP